MVYKNKDKICWIGLWYVFFGYWMGIFFDNDFLIYVKNSFYFFNGSFLFGKSILNIDMFY